MNNEMANSAVSSDILSESQSKQKGKLSKFLTSKAYLGLAFIIPVVIMYLLYVAMEIYPFGDGSVLVLDLNGQYVYFFEALRNIVYKGGSFIYSFSRALGGEFMGIFAYYIASPFAFLVLLFKKSQILDALLVMFLLKCGLCGFTFGYYLHKTSKNPSKIMIIAFSTMYALSSYAIVQQHNTMWIDSLIYLPLIALGIENLIKYRKYKLFVITLTLSVMSNFYIGYMVCIFVALYFFYYYFSKIQNGENNPTGEDKHFLRALVRIIIFSAIAIGIAMIIIAPAAYSLTFGKNDFSNPNYNLYQKFDFLDMITKFFPGSYDTVRPEGLPFIYSGVFTLMLLPVYFTSRKISKIERVLSGVFGLFFVISFNASFLDLVWHGMQFPNWLNYRYSFMLCFLMLVLAYKGFENLEYSSIKTVLYTAIFYVCLLIVIQKFDFSNMPDIEGIWLSILCVLIYSLLLYAVKATNKNESIMIITTSLICLELFCSGLLNMISLGDDVIYSSRSSYLGFINKYQPIVDYVKDYDKSFYRMEKTEHRKTNDAMSLWYRGLTNSTSTLNTKTIDFLRDMGYSSHSHWSKYLGGTPINDSLLGLKYIISEYEPSPLYEKIYEQNNLKVYKNPYALSVAYGVSHSINDYRMVFEDDSETGEEVLVKKDTYINPFSRINAIVSRMLGEKADIKIFAPIKQDSVTTTNCEVSYIAGHIKYLPTDPKKDGNIYYSFTAVNDSEVYFYLPSDYPRQVKLTLNGVYLDTFYGNETSRIMPLGRFKEGEKVSLIITIDQTDLYVWNKDTAFYYLDENVFKDVMEKLAVSQFEITDYTEDRLKGTINITEGHETVLTTIPYDKGWNVYVDGKKVETYEAFDALIAFDTTVGEHTLEMRYMSKSIIVGISSTVICIAIFVSICILDSVIKNKKEKTITENAATAQNQ